MRLDLAGLMFTKPLVQKFLSCPVILFEWTTNLGTVFLRLIPITLSWTNSKCLTLRSVPMLLLWIAANRSSRVDPWVPPRLFLSSSLCKGTVFLLPVSLCPLFALVSKLSIAVSFCCLTTSVIFLVGTLFTTFGWLWACFGKWEETKGCFPCVEMSSVESLNWRDCVLSTLSHVFDCSSLLSRLSCSLLCCSRICLWRSWLLVKILVALILGPGKSKWYPSFNRVVLPLSNFTISISTWPPQMCRWLWNRSSTSVVLHWSDPIKAKIPLPEMKLDSTLRLVILQFFFSILAKAKATWSSCMGVDKAENLNVSVGD